MSNQGGLGVGGLAPTFRSANLATVNFDPIALAQSAWQIDAVNGADNATGRPGQPIQTFGELKRRWGPNPVLRQPVTITCLTDLPSSDPVNLSVFLANPAFPFDMRGTMTTRATGTFTGVVARNRLVPAGGQRWEVADGAVVWTSHIDRRIRITSGPRAGAYAWIQQNLGGGACQTTEWALPGDFALTRITPVIGDPYVVEDPSQIFLESIGIGGEASDGAVTVAVFLRDFWWRVANGFGISSSSIQNINMQVEGCRIEPILIDRSSSYYQNNNIVNALAATGGGNVQVEAGALGSPTGIAAGFAANPVNGTMHLDDDVLVRGASVGQAGVLDVGTAGFWDSTGAGVSNPLGSGIYVRPSGSLTQQFGDGGVRQIWGGSNAGHGIDQQSGVNSTVLSVPNVIGALSDFRLGGAVTSRAWNEAGNAYTALIANSWANFAAAVPAGFGGNAHNVERSSNLVTEI